jgi:hypothetical protein
MNSRSNQGNMHNSGEIQRLPEVFELVSPFDALFIHQIPGIPKSVVLLLQ